jgi:hypothetical protein
MMIVMMTILSLMVFTAKMKMKMLEIRSISMELARSSGIMWKISSGASYLRQKRTRRTEFVSATIYLHPPSMLSLSFPYERKT